MAVLVIQNSEAITITSLADKLGRDLSTLSKSAERLRKWVRDNDIFQERHNYNCISDALKISNCPA